jgi:hypothetical protein
MGRMAAFLLVALWLLTLGGHATVATLRRAPRPPRGAAADGVRRVRRSIAGRRHPTYGGDRYTAANGVPGSAPAAVRRSRPRDPRRQDGVVGFVIGLILVTIALSAAVALAARSAG